MTSGKWIQNNTTRKKVYETCRRNAFNNNNNNVCPSILMRTTYNHPKEKRKVLTQLSTHKESYKNIENM